MDEICTVALQPAPVVFFALKALVSNVSPQEGQAHTFESGVRIGPDVEEGLGQRLVGSRGGPETEACDDPGRIGGGEQTKALIPSQTIGPTNVSVAGEPSVPSTLTVPDGHRRAVESLVRVLWWVRKKARQVQGESLDEFCARAHTAVELRAVGQGREGVPQLGVGVAVEVPLAGKTAPTGKDGQGNDLALGEGGFGTGPSSWRLRVAEVVHYDVKCGEEGVHVEHEESVPFPWGSGGKLTLECGHLPLKSSTYNSHQAFKGEAAFGKDTLLKQTFYGFRAHVRVCWPGVITRLSVAPANAHELSVVPELTEHTSGLLVGDRNYHSPRTRQELEGKGIELLAPYSSKKRDPHPKRSAFLSRLRYRIDTVFSQLTERYSVKRVWARDLWHLASRLLRKVLSHTVAFLLNHQVGNPSLQLSKLLI